MTVAIHILHILVFSDMQAAHTKRVICLSSVAVAFPILLLMLHAPSYVNMPSIYTTAHSKHPTLLQTRQLETLGTWIKCVHRALCMLVLPV